MAPALQVLTYPFLALTVLTLGRGWILESKSKTHWRGSWARRSSVILVASTVASVVLWGLRFAGVLGARPF